MTRRLSLRWKLAGAFFLIILALVSSVGLYLLEWTEGYYVRSVSGDLRRESRAAASLAEAVSPRDAPGTVARLGKDLGHRITVIKADGTVVADSERDYRRMPNHSDRPEVRAALATGYGIATRYSATLRTDMLYVATRWERNGEVAGVVRVAEPLSGLREVMSTIRRTFLLAGIIAVLIAALLSVKLTSSITTPVESIASAARRLSRGDLTARVTAPDGLVEEMGALARTFNEMAEQLQGTIGEITEQKARMQAIFDHTDDGLLLVGPDGRIQMANPTACRMIGGDCADAAGKTVIEGTLSHDLAGLVDRVMRTREPGALDIALSAQDEQAVYAYVSPIAGSDGKSGALAVLHDVTASRRLDAVRRDFVANVSHELRTPLAAIKAMAETILLRHKDDPSASPRFAEKIVREADHMTLLADDLLDLAQIESGQRTLTPRNADLRALVDDVLGRLRAPAETREVGLIAHVPEDVSVFVDPDGLGQILRNLVDNAVKYSHDGGEVVVSAERDGEDVVIRVADNGIGIPEDDLPRIFERFYRVDKARSRQSGGTGLGLSIVKHLLELIGGSMSVTSEVGRGTTFELRLPAGPTPGPATYEKTAPHAG